MHFSARPSPESRSELPVVNASRREAGLQAPSVHRARQSVPGNLFQAHGTEKQQEIPTQLFTEFKFRAGPLFRGISHPLRPDGEGKPADAIDLLGDDHFAGLKVRDHAQQLGPVRASARRLLAVDPGDVALRSISVWRVRSCSSVETRR
jgi:hypothetical protein